MSNVYLIQNKPPQLINGKRRTTLNDISFFIPSTPLKLAQQFNVLGIYKLDFPKRPMNRPPVVDTSVINSTYKDFIEIILQNSDTTIQSYHLDGYAFFVVGYVLFYINFLISYEFKRSSRLVILVYMLGWIMEYGRKIVEVNITSWTG